MAAFEPNHPDYRAVAARLFDGQPAMRTRGISLGPARAGRGGIARMLLFGLSLSSRRSICWLVTFLRLRP
jgi:hypothetical protein